MRFKILVVDQFSGLTPYWLQQHSYHFELLCKDVLNDPKFRTAKVLEVDESYVPPFGTTAFRAAQDGSAEIWKYRWDSSG